MAIQHHLGHHLGHPPCSGSNTLALGRQHRSNRSLKNTPGRLKIQDAMTGGGLKRDSRCVMSCRDWHLKTTCRCLAAARPAGPAPTMTTLPSLAGLSFLLLLGIFILPWMNAVTCVGYQVSLCQDCLPRLVRRLLLSILKICHLHMVSEHTNTGTAHGGKADSRVFTLSWSHSWLTHPRSWRA